MGLDLPTAGLPVTMSPFCTEGEELALPGDEQVEDTASRWIRFAPCPGDGRRDRRGAAAREHVFVELPVYSVVIGPKGPQERAVWEDVGAGRGS